MFSPASTVLPHVRDGKLIALASTQLSAQAWRPSCRPCRKPACGIRHRGLDRTAGTRRHAARGRRQARAREPTRRCRMRDVIEPLQQQGIDMLGGTPEEFAAYIKSEIAKWERVTAAAGMRP